MAKSEAEWRGIFKQFDKDGSGCVTIQELKAGLKEQYGCDVSDADVTNMFCGIDSDGSKTLTEQEFVDEIVNKTDRRKGFAEKFREVDADGSGCIDLKELQAFLDSVGVSLEQVKGCSALDDGKITFDEFMSMV